MAKKHNSGILVWIFWSIDMKLLYASDLYIFLKNNIDSLAYTSIYTHIFHIEESQTLEQVFQRCCAVSTFGGFQDPTGKSPE